MIALRVAEKMIIIHRKDAESEAPRGGMQARAVNFHSIF